MNLIKRIKIENIKGKKLMDITFNNLICNQPNILVAPNGYGKSTIAMAFKAAKHKNFKLSLNDVYQSNNNNIPKLEIEAELNNRTQFFTATNSKNNISSNFAIEVIDSPLIAKSVTKKFGLKIVSTADLRLEDIVIYDSIPEKMKFNYSYRTIKKALGNNGELFHNISNMISNFENIKKFNEIKEDILKCAKQTKIQNKFDLFLNIKSNKDLTEETKNEKTNEILDDLKKNQHVNKVFECIEKAKDKPKKWKEQDVVPIAKQLCYFLKNETHALNSICKYSEYEQFKKIIDERLHIFNTTGRAIKTHEQQGKLVVHFEKAETLSNGERDILSFIVNLTKFEISFKKNFGILIIDEVFDYLDGANLLAVQYYLMQLIKNCSKKGKILFPILFTHLDPEVFSNYYFQKKKIHYISIHGNINTNSDLVKILQLRGNGTLSNDEKNKIEKYYLHYNDEEIRLEREIANKISISFSYTNFDFRTKLYKEVTEIYLNEFVSNYDPLMVIAGVRIRIEEIIFNKLEKDKQKEFIEKHRVINKLNYAIDNGIEVPELMFLLQPLYNDGMHLSEKIDEVANKIKSTYLKTNNNHIRKLIRFLFDEDF